MQRCLPARRGLLDAREPREDDRRDPFARPRVHHPGLGGFLVALAGDVQRRVRQANRLRGHRARRDRHSVGQDPRLNGAIAVVRHVQGAVEIVVPHVPAA